MIRNILLATGMLVSTVAVAEAQCGGTGAPSISNGQIVGPNGQPLKGINIYADQLLSQGADAITSTFPGINLVRLNVFDLNADTPSTLLPIIKQLNSKGVVVEVEDHNYPAVLYGPNLDAATSWYRQWAEATIGNPGVIFGTQNEPDLSQGVGAVNSEIHAIYDAIRSTGNNSIVFVNPSGGFSTSGIDLSGMSNVAWDLHYYNWAAGNSTDLGANQSALANEVSGAQATANIPAYIGEYGISSGAMGAVNDPGGIQVIQAVQQSGLSSAAWAWTSGDPSFPLLLNDPFGNPSNGLTQFGQMTKDHLASPSSSCGGTPILTEIQSDQSEQSSIPAAPMSSTAWQSAGPSCPMPSGAINPGAGSVTDASGNVYTVDPATGNQVMVNGQPATPNGEGTQTSAVTVVDGQIYGQDENTRQWSALIQNPGRPYWQPLTVLPAFGQQPISTTRWDTAPASAASCADATKQNASGTQNPTSGTVADLLKVCSDPATTSNPTNATICAQAQQTQALMEQTNASINANQKTATPPSPTGPGI